MGVTLVLMLILISSLCGFFECRRPDIVHVGAIFAFNSTIGKVAKVAMQIALKDINENSSILGGTKLNLFMEDSNCSALLGSIAALRLFDKGAVAIIGPQSSATSHMVSFISNGLQVPLVSFAATDPTLSSPQFPFFLRSTLSDSFQMIAITDLICFYQWRQIIAIYIDDDHGRNGVAILDDELGKKMSKVYKVALPLGASHRDIMDSLEKSKMLGPRIYLVHANPGKGLDILSIAHHLYMMTDGYVWLATDWLSTSLDLVDPSQHQSFSFLHGVIGLRQHIPPSQEKNIFLSRWKEFLKEGTADSKMNVYGLYAYDTVWVIAHAINSFLNEFNNISFSSIEGIESMERGFLQWGNLRVFDGGKLLFDKLLETNFTGLTGRVKFDASDRNLMNGTFEIINVVGSKTSTVGYWSNYSHLSVLPPETLHAMTYDRFNGTQQLGNVVWPGGKKEKPRGWVIADREKPLKIGVPRRSSYVEFVTEMKDTHQIEGYCIDVFYAALKLIPYKVSFEFVPFGDGRSNPNYYELVKKVEDNVFDAAVGDIAIVTTRTDLIDFTQPYIATGLVIVAPVRTTNSSIWVFLKPFTLQMWCVTVAFFFLIGFVIWVLEHRKNDDFRGPPRQQLITIFLFSFSTLFQTNKEVAESALGRFVMMMWLFLVMVITSSYTASLTSILTCHQLSSPITGIYSLIASNWHIGIQAGSFAESYLTDALNVQQSRLVSLRNQEEFERYLHLGPKNGGVAAIVDELPYMELFLANRSDFGIIGDAFTKNGWGFAFKKGSPLALDMSTAFLQLSENGELQNIHDRWFCHGSCDKGRKQKFEPNQLNLSSFWGLFLVCGAALMLAVLLFLLRSVHQFIRVNRNKGGSSMDQLSCSGCSQSVHGFFKFIGQKEQIEKTFNHHESDQP